MSNIHIEEFEYHPEFAESPRASDRFAVRGNPDEVCFTDGSKHDIAGIEFFFPISGEPYGFVLTVDDATRLADFIYDYKKKYEQAQK